MCRIWFTVVTSRSDVVDPSPPLSCYDTNLGQYLWTLVSRDLRFVREVRKPYHLSFYRYCFSPLAVAE